MGQGVGIERGQVWVRVGHEGWNYIGMVECKAGTDPDACVRNPLPMKTKETNRLHSELM